MKAARLFIVALCSVAFAGCVVKGPEVEVKPPIAITVDGDDHGGKHCPPGQAKKGRC